MGGGGPVAAEAGAGDLAVAHGHEPRNGHAATHRPAAEARTRRRRGPESGGPGGSRRALGERPGAPAPGAGPRPRHWRLPGVGRRATGALFSGLERRRGVYGGCAKKGKEQNTSSLEVPMWSPTIVLIQPMRS